MHDLIGDVLGLLQNYVVESLIHRSGPDLLLLLLVEQQLGPEFDDFLFELLLLHALLNADFSYTWPTCSKHVNLKPRLLRGHIHIRQYPINVLTVSSVVSAMRECYIDGPGLESRFRFRVSHRVTVQVQARVHLNPEPKPNRFCFSPSTSLNRVLCVPSEKGRAGTHIPTRTPSAYAWGSDSFRLGCGGGNINSAQRSDWYNEFLVQIASFGPSFYFLLRTPD